VQAALDKLQLLQRRTAIIVAHKLSTVRNADKIVMLSGGRVTEEGTHTELMARRGVYSELNRRPSVIAAAPLSPAQVALV
jgi:ABC-type multidrug transport system fused ATPase/permease subunit